MCHTHCFYTCFICNSSFRTRDLTGGKMYWILHSVINIQLNTIFYIPFFFYWFVLLKSEEQKIAHNFFKIDNRSQSYYKNCPCGRNQDEQILMGWVLKSCEPVGNETSWRGPSDFATGFVNCHTLAIRKDCTLASWLDSAPSAYLDSQLCRKSLETKFHKIHWV